MEGNHLFAAKALKILSLSMALAACNNGPETLQAQQSDSNPQSGNGSAQSVTDIFSPSGQKTSQPAGEVRQGKIVEVLEGGRYAYLRISQPNGNSEWVVTRRASFAQGKTYRYGAGIVKTGYYSTDLQRTFDEIRLVANIAPVGAQSGSAGKSSSPAASQAAPPEAPQKPITAQNSVALKDIVAQPNQYAGEVIRVTGKVMKINPNIMNRNWIHIQDGTANDYDFVLTAQKTVPVGHTATFEGVLNVNRDFGAGYQYDIILEHAELIP